MTWPDIRAVAAEELDGHTTVRVRTKGGKNSLDTPSTR
ncbi:MAG: hypothetical protein LZF62_390013 [Nitrospira sp.]|nr:MAG: hypothetical protein LZF62_390013 [Nitrospira sp.]